MRALITGASSGIGREMAIQLSQMGYDLVLAARSQDKLEELQRLLPTRVSIHCLDLSEESNCHTLHEAVKDELPDLLINNAGFGIFGEFVKGDLDAELNLIDLNIRALHILTKLFLRDFVAAGRGTILNTSSIAAFMPGPLMSSYYASKAYVQRLTEAIYGELSRQKSPVHICALCPGPVKTNFNRRAGAAFLVDGPESGPIAAYALKKMFAGKLVIIPGWPIRLMRFFVRFVGTKSLLKIIFRVQSLRRRQPA